LTSITHNDARRILSDLIAIPSVNPMGCPHQGPQSVEHDVAEYVRSLFAPFGVHMTTQECGSMHENLLIEVPGRDASRNRLMESHMDTVPADDWLDRAFQPRYEDGRVIGRGACDDKGPLASMILAVREILLSGKEPPANVLLLAAGDEEYAQTGIKCFTALGRPLENSVFGEATRIQPIVQHKGTVRWDIITQGKSAHTSQRELGRNAILDSVKVIEALAAYEEQIQSRYRNHLMTGPRLTVTMIHGGRTRNAVPDQCRIAVDYRVLPGMDPAEAREDVIRALEQTGLPVSHGAVQLLTPPLNTQPQHKFSQSVLEICRSFTGQADMDFAGAPYGTDAAWVSDVAPAIVLGPGSIDHAHSVDEHIEVDDVVCCARVYHQILMDNRQSG
jgi:acetylornithine deacetylase/succinyl-diaminopimelate desuccinylase-like protein